MLRQIVMLLLSAMILTIPTDMNIPDINDNSAKENEAMEVLVNEDDIYWLSRLIYAEAGADYCSDELQYAVGSVVLNRVNSDLYPNTVKEVIFDTKHGVQYGCVTNGMIYRTPNDRAMQCAEWLLRCGSLLPENVLGQADRCVLTGVYKTIDGVVFSYY